MPFDFIPPARLVDKTIGSYPITPGSTAAKLFDATIGAPSVASLFGLSIAGIPPNANVGDSTVFLPLIAGGTPGYTLSLLSGALPPGRSISGLTVAGTYTAAGIYAYTLRVTDSLGATADLPVSVVVSAAGTALAISGTLPQGTVGQAYSFTPTVTGGSGTKSFTLTGTLPSGLSFSSSTGAISGTPGAAFNGNISIQVTDSSGSATLGPQALIVASTGPITDANITATNTDGWSVANSAVGTAPGKYLVLSRPGFDTTGGATTYSETLTQTKNVRQVFPNQASLDATRMALSDFLYSTDTIVGSSVANSSPLTSPAPICIFARLDRKLVGNTMPATFLEVAAFHRNARNGSEVACVVWTLTDGTNTVTAKASTMVKSLHPGDLTTVLVYRPVADVDITSLTAGQIKVDAKVYPWIGTAQNSVADSSQLASGGRSATAQGVFCSQYFLKNVAYAANPPLAYVSTTGSDTTGVVSTSAGTASATPFATMYGALNGLKAAMTGGDIGGGRVRLMAGTQAQGTVPASAYTGAVIGPVIEGDPASTPANVTLSMTTVNPMRIPWPIFSGLTISRGTNAQWSSPTFYISLESVLFANNSVNFGWLASATKGKLCGVRFTGGAANLLLQSATQTHLLQRGVTNVDDGATLGGLEPVGVLGCKFFGGRVAANTSLYGVAESGAVVAFNKFMKCTATSIVIGAPVSDATNLLAIPCYGAAIVQNVFEATGTAVVTGVGIGPDGLKDTIYHAVLHNNTTVGFNKNGRANLLYDEASIAGTEPNARRNHTLHSMRGNTWVSKNHKDDWFYGTNSANTDGDANLRTGTWSALYGVGMDGEFTQFADANAGQTGSGLSNFGLSFAGSYSAASGQTASTANGTSNTVGLDPKFTAPGTGASEAAAGTGDGDYSLQAGSPLTKLMSFDVLPFDLAGNARANGTTGAYALAG